MRRRFYCMLAAVCLILALMPAVRATDIVKYAVTGGYIKFDKSDGTVMGRDSYVSKVVIPDTIEGVSVTSIGYQAFINCQSLTSVSIAKSVTSIGDYSFAFCNNLTSVSIPNSMISIGEWAFANCTGLKSVSIPESVTSIGYCAFENCPGLTNISIPKSVTSIGYAAFSRCSRLTGITVATDNPAYRSIDGILFNKDATVLHTYPDTKKGAYSIPNSVTSIAYGAFDDCTGLTSVTIPDSVTSIGECAFYHCTGLTSVSIPDGVTSIGRSTFNLCESLTSVSIPNSVTSIDEAAFSSCSKLTDVYYDGTQAEYETKLLPNVDNRSNGNDRFLNANLYFNDDVSPNPDPPSPNPPLPNTAASDHTALHGTLFLLLAALTLTVWAIGRRYKSQRPDK